MRIFIINIGFFALFCNAVQAGAVTNACLKAKSDRRLCKCVQAAADATLSRGDQNRAAAMMFDPEKSQDVKTSNSRRDEKFWERYKEFGELAEQFCG